MEKEGRKSIQSENMQPSGWQHKRDVELMPTDDEVEEARRLVEEIRRTTGSQTEKPDTDKKF